jgi:DNA-directed RNA polymerase beta' subunit
MVKGIDSRRVNNSARTLVSGDPTLAANEVIVPDAIALNITVPIRVQQYNIKYVTELVHKGDATILIRDGKKRHLAKALFDAGTPVFPTDVVTRKGKNLKVVDTIAKGDRFVLQEGDVLTRADGEVIEKIWLPRRKFIELQIGDIVQVYIQERMWCIVNRQPTLHKGSLFAMKIRRIKAGKSIRVPLSICGALNADQKSRFAKGL